MDPIRSPYAPYPIALDSQTASAKGAKPGDLPVEQPANGGEG